MAAYIWIFIHFIIASCFLVGGRSIYLLFYPIILLLSLNIFLLKPVSYDLAFYLDYFLQPEPTYEPLFYFISKLFSTFQNESLSLFLMMLLSAYMYYLSLKIFKVSFFKFLLMLPLYTNSIFFLLGSQNAIRQFLSATILILALSFLINMHLKLIYMPKKMNIKRLSIYVLIFIYLLFWGSIASLFHWSSLFFVLILFVVWFSTEIIRKKVFNIKIVYFVNLIFGLLISLILHEIYSEAYFTYLDRTMDWGSERTSNNIKAILIFAYVYVTGYLLKSVYPTINYLAEVREVYLFFVLPFAFVGGEIFPRLVFFLYAIDIFLISLIFSKREKLSLRERIALSISYIIYGISPNALNILGLNL